MPNPERAATNPRLPNIPQSRNKLANPRTKAVSKVQCNRVFVVNGKGPIKQLVLQ